MNKELWYLLIEGQKDANTGIVGNFYAYGEHLGDSLKKVINASSYHHFTNSHLIQASFLEHFDLIENNHELLSISDDVYMRTNTFTFIVENDPDTLFIPPIGIVEGVSDNELDYDLIKESFVAYGQNENELFEFELVVAKHNLVDVFLKAIEFLPSVDGFWIYIKSYWENGLTELWVAKHFVDKQTVIDFLKIQKINTLENGFLNIVVHSQSGETNLILDDHKKIQLFTKEETVFSEFIGNIIDLGYEQTKDFHSLEFGYFHFHYRQADSLARNEFKAMLREYQFELIDKWEE